MPKIRMHKTAFLSILLAGLIPFGSVPQAADPETDRLDAIVGEYTARVKRLDAYHAPFQNVESDLQSFGDYGSDAYFERSRKTYIDALEKLDEIHFELLPESSQTTFLLFKENLVLSLLWYDSPEKYLEFNQMSNRLHSYIDSSNQTISNFPFDSVKHYQDYIKRSEGFPVFIDNLIKILREGIQKKFTLNCEILRATQKSYKDGLEKTLEKNPFWRPIGFMPHSFAPADRERIREGFRSMIRERILPAFERIDQFLNEEYFPNCRTSFGLSGLPNGKKYYEYAIYKNTDLKMDPREIHELGLREVSRISAEIAALQEQMGIEGSQREFMQRLRNDPKYAFQSAEQMFHAFLAVKAKIAEKVPHFFELKPAIDYRLAETSNPEDPSGSYLDPTEHAPYGRFIVNTKNLRSIPAYDVTTLMLHETVPGHHYQSALQFEMKEQLSEFRRQIFNSVAFAEGWALYAEYLGNEMGMFSDLLQRVGNLNYEMLRAVRLVVDTGIHAFGWSREEAIAYMTEHLAMDEKLISNEVNRYSVWPGQALAYKLGQLKIIELRKLAEKKLGPKFSLKKFHRVVIGSGTISLGVLEAKVHSWLEANQE